MSGPRLREATESDRIALLSLYRQLAESEYEFEIPHRELLVPPNERFENLARHLEGLGKDECTWLVLEQESQLLGCVSVRRVRPPQIIEDVVEISDLVVDAQHRGNGLGRRLFEGALDWSRKRGIRGAMLSVMEFNTISRRGYERAGMYTTGRTLAMDL